MQLGDCWRISDPIWRGEDFKKSQPARPGQIQLVLVRPWFSRGKISEIEEVLIKIIQMKQKGKHIFKKWMYLSGLRQEQVV